MLTALTAANIAFDLLVSQPTPVAFDARLIPGLPDRHLPLDELRDLLVRTTVDADISDAVWRDLAGHARCWGQAWMVGAVGVAVPGLTKMAARLSRAAPKLAPDIDAEILTGFLHELRTADLAPPRIWLRLCWAAWRSGYAVCRVEETVELPPDLPSGSRTPRLPYGHPDLLLGRAVASGHLTQAQADLIGATRLGDVLVEQVAAENGVSASVIRMRRKRAERILVAALHRGEIGGAVLEATFVGDRAAEALRNGVASLPPRRHSQRRNPMADLR